MAEEKKDTKQKKERISSAKKRILQSTKARTRNRSFKSEVRTALRSLHDALEKKDSTSMKDKLQTVFSLMDKGVKKGVFKSNKAARTKSTLSKKVYA